jgi:Family of unknown function (DUF5706)
MDDQKQSNHMLLDPASGGARLAIWQALRESPAAADRKGAAALTAHSLLLSIVMFLAPRLAWTLSTHSLAGTFVLTMTAVLVGLVLIGGWSAFRALVKPMPSPGNSLAWLGNIAAMDRQAYIQAMHTLDARRAQHDALEYNYSIAQQAGQKYGLVQRSIGCFRIAILLWMGLVLLGMIWGR